jgi:D-alanyl-lipoteichoic acid acyltransferase DltB (MBOAT superfamily)
LTFDLRAIFIFVLLAGLYAGLLPKRWRQWLIYIASIVAIFWLQPPLPIRFSDYIFPVATLFLAVLVWAFTRQPAGQDQPDTTSQDRVALGVLVLVVIGLSFMRYVDADFRITASRPPSPIAVLVAVLSLAAVTAVLLRLTGNALQRRNRQVLSGLILLIVAVFVLFKSAPLATGFSSWWRSWTGQDVTLASPLDLGWLGFSFVAFRLIHTVRERQLGTLPYLSLQEYVSYAIFFPAYTAGPIDRAERFVVDFRGLPMLAGLDMARIAEGSWRILLGMFKKFVIADSLAQGMALTAANAEQVSAGPYLWLLLYGYAFRLYFDFAGYTDIAIGIGILFGVRMPENFRRPYLRTSLAAFWQSWHITLSNWVRFYVFSPLSRWLLRRPRRPSPTVIVFTAQMATMIVIGLWHGITWNFLVWGMWHGVGLFIHKQWSDRTRSWYRGLSQRPLQKKAWSVTAWFVTFQYVVLGWVWFAMPSIDLSLTVFARLFGVGG